MKRMFWHNARLQTGLLLVVVFAGGFLFGNLSGTNAQERAMIGDVDEAFAPLWEVFDAIQTRYVDRAEIEVPMLVDGAINGMVEALGDEYSGYLSPTAFAQFSDISGEVEGIGVVIDTIEETGEIVVITVLRGAAAEAAGVLPGDIFWEVNGEAVIGMNQTDLAAAVRGPAGTDVNITFKRGEDMIEMTITRVRFQVPNIETEILDNNIAYISMAEFTALAREQVDAALDELDVNSRTGLIFDLRGNPGGLLTSAVDMGSLFIEEGVLLYEAFADGSEEIFQASGDYGNITVPIVVLIDETSASASELIAGAIKDTGVATLIGETTFGKGTVQNIQPLSNNGGIRLTVARWLTPNRNWIHEVGVTPDIVVDWDPQTAEDFAAPDPQLQAAVDFLLSQ